MNFLCGDEKRFFEFMSNLNDKDKIAVIAHDDGDGVGSAVIASKVIGKVDLVYFYDFSPGTLLPVIREIKKKKINKVFVLDLNLPENYLKEIARTSEVLVIDHHPFEKDLNSDRIIFIKSDSGAACYVCYYLFSKIQKVPEWIAAMGTLSDTTHKYSESNIGDFFRDFGFSRSDNLREKTLDLGFALVYFNGKTEKVYDLLMSAKNFDELGIEKYARIVREEFESKLEEYKNKKEECGNLIFYYFEPKYGIKAMLINKLSVENYNRTLVFIQKINNKDILDISLRSQSGNINCPELFKRAISGIPDSNSGGHYRAAGCRIPYKYLDKFKDNLIKEYKKLRKISNPPR